MRLLISIGIAIAMFIGIGIIASVIKSIIPWMLSHPESFLVLVGAFVFIMIVVNVYNMLEPDPPPDV